MCINQRTEDRGQKTDVILSSVLCPLSSERGVSLIELIMFIVIISVAVTGVLLVMNQVTGHSADSLIRKQALVVAESLLEEIESQDFNNPTGGFTGPATQANRWQFDDVMDYNGFATVSIFPAASSVMPVPGLGGYNVSAVVAATALGNIPAASAVVITVRVTDPTGQTIDATGYRTAY